MTSIGSVKMKQISAEDCITQILKDIDKRKTVNYADKNSVRRYNAAMDRIIVKANYLCDNYPDKMNLFISLLDHPDYDICSTCTAVYTDYIMLRGINS